MNDFTKRFNEALEETGLTGAQVSNLLKIHPPTLVKYKKGTSGMSLETLYNFCKTFGISSDWLLGLEAQNKEYETLKLGVTGNYGMGKSNLISQLYSKALTNQIMEDEIIQEYIKAIEERILEINSQNREEE